MNIKRNALGIFCFFLALAGLFSAAFTKPAQAATNNKYAAIIMDADTGLILYQRYADKHLHPASLTKVMTLVMVFDALESGQLNLKDRIIISRHAASMSPSKLNLSPGSSIRVKDAIYALVTKSANDVAVAIAEHLGGSEQNFARMMTRKAHQYGMRSTIFKNASGLHHSGQISTARDMARLARVALTDYGQYYHYFSEKSFTYQGYTYRNHNRLMGKYIGMDGIKTGYIQPSGFNLMASAKRNNHRLIGIVFGGRTAHSRNAHMAKLMDSGFAKLNEIRVASAKAPLPPRKPGVLVALNALGALSPASGREDMDEASKLAMLNPSLQTGMFSKLIGQGDYDPAVSKRIETGLMAIAAIKNEDMPRLSPAVVQPANLSVYRAASKINPAAWAIQVGAFKSRASTDKAIHNTMKKLPSDFSRGTPIIVPLKTKDGLLFRGRLTGFSRAEAFKACTYLRECLPVAPVM